MMRLLSTLTNTIGLLLLSPMVFANNYNLSNNNPTAPTSLEIKNNLLKKAGVFDLRFTETMRHEIEGYTIRGKKTTQKIIGRAQIYFPIIENYLRAYNLPEELKYITVIESALNPNARSSAGAVGLWQLMPATARRYGLIINSQVDERKDPHKSTQAALKLSLIHI